MATKFIKYIHIFFLELLPLQTCIYLIEQQAYALIKGAMSADELISKTQ